MADLKFKLTDHPSDVGLIAYGRDRREIFENAALGLFSLMADLQTVEVKEVMDVKITAGDLDELLVNWLNELIFIAETKKMLCKQFKIIRLTEKELAARVGGEAISPGRHTLYQGIKAATFNQLQIGANQAKIVFDI